MENSKKMICGGALCCKYTDLRPAAFVKRLLPPDAFQGIFKNLKIPLEKKVFC